MSDSMTTPAIQISERAAQAVRESMASEGKSAETSYLRVAVKAGGCSGYSYQLEFVDQSRDGDSVIERDGVRLLVDPKSAVVLSGSELDYTTGLNGKGFVFNNPNATGTCGCGESFSV